jgi:hypothetical protein
MMASVMSVLFHLYGGSFALSRLVRSEIAVEEIVMGAMNFMDPVGAQDAARIKLNSRPTAMTGLRIAFVDNTKANFDHFCDRVQELLPQYGVAEIKRYRKPGRTVGISQKVRDEIKATCDFAITGLGDCGSCTSWALHDAVELEKAGVPSLCVTTTQFDVLARVEATAMGLPDVQILAVPHPLGAGLPIDKVRTKANQAMEALVHLITRI